MIGVVVPAHDEEETLPECLAALRVAAAHPSLRGETVGVLIVLDACRDQSARVVREHGFSSLVIDARAVGVARHRGALQLLADGARWLAFTDADTVVSPEWLTHQLSVGTEAVCGTVAVADWSMHPADVGARFLAEYQDRDDHRHVHGANLGLSREAYLAVGGFEELEAHEDRVLVEALERAGIVIGWSARPRVVTSSRLEGRAPAGFAAAIREHYAELGATVLATP